MNPPICKNCKHCHFGSDGVTLYCWEIIKGNALIGTYDGQTFFPNYQFQLPESCPFILEHTLSNQS